MKINFLVIAASGIIPLIIGAVFYHKAVLGKVWMQASGMTDEKMKGSNMPLIFILTYVFSVILSMFMAIFVVHQTDLYSIFAGLPGAETEGSEIQNAIKQVMILGGDNFRTFKHGSFHGVLTAVGVFFPVIAINNLFERRITCLGR